MTVREVRQNGYKVRVLHFRRLEYEIVQQQVPETYSSYLELKFVGVNPCGGKTIVEITSPEGKDSYGVAYCHPSLNYNKKVLVKFALQRALEAIENV